jgi:flagellin-like hook-associated protein FlgL
VGSWEVRLQASRDAMDDADLISNETLEALEGLDIADAITDYTARESSYKAVLSVFARIMSTENLFDLTR